MAAKRRRRKYGDNWLKRAYLEYNKKYFNGLLPKSLTVKWEHCDDDFSARFFYDRIIGAHVWRAVGIKPLNDFLGRLQPEHRPYISLEPRDVEKEGDKSVKIDLLHEQIHAYIYMVEGYDEYDDHGPRFEEWKRRLYEMGALETLW